MIATAARHVIALSKLRIVALLVFTAACGMWKAAGGVPDGTALVAVVVGGALAAAGANAINQGLDSDIDALMLRTRGRVVPRSAVSRRAALAIGAVMILAAVIFMGLLANWLAASLTLAAAAVYVFVYTIALKRNSWNNIVIGGAAGAFPPLIGAAAVSGSIDAVGLYMFAFVFFWTPPHFWTLSIMLREEYSAAGIPMLASVATSQLDPRTLPSPAPRPSVSRKFCHACAFQLIRSTPEAPPSLSKRARSKKSATEGTVS